MCRNLITPGSVEGFRRSSPRCGSPPFSGANAVSTLRHFRACLANGILGLEGQNVVFSVVWRER